LRYDSDDNDNEHKEPHAKFKKRKIERYEHHKFKKPEGKKAPPSFQYQADNVMSNQATAYAELLKICNKHHASKKCLMTSRHGLFIS
jgi:hypothetical protein